MSRRHATAHHGREEQFATVLKLPERANFRAHTKQEMPTGQVSGSSQTTAKTFAEHFNTTLQLIAETQRLLAEADRILAEIRPLPLDQCRRPEKARTRPGPWPTDLARDPKSLSPGRDGLILNVRPERTFVASISRIWPIAVVCVGLLTTLVWSACLVWLIYRALLWLF